MKDLFIKAIGLIAVALILFFSVRYVVVASAKTEEAAYQWRLNWADRR